MIIRDKRKQIGEQAAEISRGLHRTLEPSQLDQISYPYGFAVTLVFVSHELAGLLGCYH